MCHASPEVTNVPECVETVEWGIPLALPALVHSDRKWVEVFCVRWGACHE